MTTLRLVATYKTPTSFCRGSTQALAVSSRSENCFWTHAGNQAVVHIADLAAESAYIKERHPHSLQASNSEGFGPFSQFPC